MVKKQERPNEEQLIRQHIDPNWDRYPGGRADARLRDSGVPVWALVGHLRAVNDIDQVARDYELSHAAVDAALAYYQRYKDLIDARLLLNTA